MQKLFSKNIKLNKNYTNICKSKFSTLIVPEIIEGKIHSSVLNLTTAATQLDKDVKLFFNIKIHLLLFGNNLDNNIINEAKKIKNVTKILVYNNSTLSNP